MIIGQSSLTAVNSKTICHVVCVALPCSDVDDVMRARPQAKTRDRSDVNGGIERDADSAADHLSFGFSIASCLLNKAMVKMANPRLRDSAFLAAKTGPSSV